MEFVSSEDANADLLPGARRQDAGATDVLVTLSRVNVELDDDFEAFFKFALFRDLSGGRENLRSLVLLRSVDLGGSRTLLVLCTFL